MRHAFAELGQEFWRKEREEGEDGDELGTGSPSPGGKER